MRCTELRLRPQRTEQHLGHLLSSDNQIARLRENDNIAHFLIKKQCVWTNWIEIGARQQYRTFLKNVTLFQIKPANDVIPWIIHAIRLTPMGLLLEWVDFFGSSSAFLLGPSGGWAEERQGGFLVQGPAIRRTPSASGLVLPS